MSLVRALPSEFFSSAAFNEYPVAKVDKLIRGMKCPTDKLKTRLPDLWEGIFKDGRCGIFMRNYACGGRFTDNLIDL